MGRRCRYWRHNLHKRNLFFCCVYLRCPRKSFAAVYSTKKPCLSFVGLSSYSRRLYPRRDDRITPKCAYILSKLQWFLGPVQASCLVYRGSANFLLMFSDRMSYPVLPLLRGLVLLLSLVLCKGDVCCLSQGLNFIGFYLWVVYMA